MASLLDPLMEWQLPMAKATVEVLIEDLDGPDGAQTVTGASVVPVQPMARRRGDRLNTSVMFQRSTSRPIHDPQNADRLDIGLRAVRGHHQ